MAGLDQDLALLLQLEDRFHHRAGGLAGLQRAVVDHLCFLERFFDRGEVIRDFRSDDLHRVGLAHGSDGDCFSGSGGRSEGGDQGEGGGGEVGDLHGEDSRFMPLRVEAALVRGEPGVGRFARARPPLTQTGSPASSRPESAKFQIESKPHTNGRSGATGVKPS